MNRYNKRSEYIFFSVDHKINRKQAYELNEIEFQRKKQKKNKLIWMDLRELESECEIEIHLSGGFESMKNDPFW